MTKKKTEPFVTKQLRNAAAIYAERNAIYGDNYHHFGQAMQGFFPRGLTISSVDDWNRLGIMVQIVAKMTRYGAAFNNGGHIDSLDDISVYAQMLQELDHSINAQKAFETSGPVG